MRISLFTATCALICAAACGDTAARLGDDAAANNDEIVNGTLANPLVYPAVGRLETLSAPIGSADATRARGCTATLIPEFGAIKPAAGEHLIITAAHCVLSDAGSGLQVTPLNTLQFVLPATAAHHKAIFAITAVHYDFNLVGTDLRSDLAVVQVKYHAGSKYFPPLDRVSTAPLDWHHGVLTLGYGITSPTKKDFGALRIAQHRVAWYEWHWLVLDSQDGKVSACHGDSGGPSYVWGPTKRTIIGVTSHGTNGQCVGVNYQSVTVPWQYKFTVTK